MTIGKAFLGCTVAMILAGRLAGSEPVELKSASHVAIATVTGVFAKDSKEQGWTYTDYVFEIVVEKLEKGEGPQTGKVLYLRRGMISKIEDKNAPIPGIIGLVHVPKEGDSIRVHFSPDEKNRFHILRNPDAVEKLKKTPK